MGELTLKAVFALILLIMSAFFSGAESALFSLKRISSRLLRENRFVKAVLEHPQKLLVTIFTGNDLANSTFTAVITATAMVLFGGKGEWISAVLTMVVIIIFAEVLPRKLAFRSPEIYSSVAAPIIYYFSKLTYPFFLITRTVSKLLPRKLREDSSFYGLGEKDLIYLFKEGSALGAIDDEERAILTQVLQLDRIRCADIMTPKHEVEMISWDASREEVQNMFKTFTHSRIPVFRDRRDNVVGILYLKDFILLPPGKDWHKVLKPPFFVPEVKTAISLLEDFRKKGTHIAIVVDEFGTYTGIITLSDVIKILFSEIGGLSLIRTVRKKGRGFLVKGNTKVEYLRHFGLDLPAEDFETISGFIMHVLERFPKEREEIIYGKWLIRVEKVERGRRILEVYIEEIKDAD